MLALAPAPAPAKCLPTMQLAVDAVEEQLSPVKKVKAPKELKVILLGAANVGKSGLVGRLLEGQFEPGYKPTIGMDHQKVALVRESTAGSKIY